MSEGEQGGSEVAPIEPGPDASRALSIRTANHFRAYRGVGFVYAINPANKIS